MNVGEFRRILENDYIPDDLVICTYEDTKIKEVNLTIDKDGLVSDIRLAMDTDD